MDYTQSPNNVVDVGTGFRRHEDNQALPTVVSEKDMNSLLWGLMEVSKAAGVAGIQFDEAVPASYKAVIKAIKRLCGANVTTVNFAASPFALTEDHAGVVLVDCAGGNVVLNLPAANVVTALPLEYVTVKTDATANTGTFNRAAANLIDGAASFVLATQYQSRTIRSNAVDAWATLGSSSAASTAKQIQPINATVAASALTLTLNPTQLDFRATPLTSGTVNSRTLAAAVSLVVPSTATLGTINAVVSRLVLLALDNAGAIELAVVNLSGGNNLDETTLISTTAISPAANAANVVYSTTARANLPFRVVGFVESTQAVAGTWATAPSTLQGVGGQALVGMNTLGYGQTWQSVTRSSGTTYYNTTGKPIYAVPALASSVTSANIVPVINGLTLPTLFLSAGSQNWNIVYPLVIPPGASYSFTFTGTTPSCFELR